ncbi:leukotriene B4 receptor 1-like [Esox lucius]|uniref:G-protein coupled receptors family 1 profile domain-containing protein n=1 Tax=Esox lucius TaxID=8010 RepID=A0A3P8XP75_ESOLU|nr:leukotriene B4 receptor 1-like [Esox lucius]
MSHNQTNTFYPTLKPNHQSIPPSLQRPSTSISPLFSTAPSMFVTMSAHLMNTTTQDKNVVANTISTTVGSLILVLAFLLGFPGNLFIIWSILLRARRRSVTTLLILNLAVADGTLMAITPFFVVFLVNQAWVFGRVMCKILFYMCLANMYASIQLIMLMSLHRLVVVVWPRRVAALASRKRVLRGVAALWMLVIIASVPPLLFREITNFQQTRNKVCTTVHEYTSYTVVQYTLETVLGFVFPYTVIVGSYICILRRIKKTKFQRRMRSEKLILAIVVTFGVFWLPYHLINIVQIAAALTPDGPAKVSLDKIWTSSRAITSTLAFISSCANPLLYTFAGKSYIRKNGIAFMARLFDRTGNDSATRKSQQNSGDREKDVGSVELKDMDEQLESTTSTNNKVTSPINEKQLKNGNY